MADGQQVLEAALAVYLERGGRAADPERKRICRESVNKVMGSLTGAEQAKFLGYIGQFSPLKASYIVREMVSGYALLFDEPENPSYQEHARESLEEFRQNYITPPVGQEEGKRLVDAPYGVCKAAIRKLLASESTFRLRLKERLDKALGLPTEEEEKKEEEKVYDFFEACPVVAVTSILRTWVWIDDDANRNSFVRRQYEQWTTHGDEAAWLDLPRHTDPIFKPVPNPNKRVFERALDSYLVNRTRNMPALRMQTRFQIERILGIFTKEEREKILSCFDKYPVEGIEEVIDKWRLSAITGFPHYFREQYQKWVATGDDKVFLEVRSPGHDFIQSARRPMTEREVEEVRTMLRTAGIELTEEMVEEFLAEMAEEGGKPTEEEIATIRQLIPKNPRRRSESTLESIARTEGINILKTVLVGVDNSLRKQAGMKTRDVEPEEPRKPTESKPQPSRRERAERVDQDENFVQEKLRKWRENNVPYEGYDLSRCVYESVWKDAWKKKPEVEYLPVFERCEEYERRLREALET